MADSLKIDFRSFEACGWRRSGGFCRRKSQSRAGTGKAPGRGGQRTSGQGGGGRKIQGQSQIRHDDRCPRRPVGRPNRRGRPRRRQGPGQDRLRSARRRHRRQGGGRAARRWLSESARPRPERRQPRRLWRSARACAATASIATRPRRTTTSRPATPRPDLAASRIRGAGKKATKARDGLAGGRHHRARPRQRAAERARPEGIRAPRRGP